MVRSGNRQGISSLGLNPKLEEVYRGFRVGRSVAPSLRLLDERFHARVLMGISAVDLNACGSIRVSYLLLEDITSVHTYYHCGIRSQKTIPIMVFGA